MTVAELIERLKDFDPAAKVKFQAFSGICEDHVMVITDVHLYTPFAGPPSPYFYSGCHCENDE